MKIERFIYKSAFWPFILFLLAVILAFWPRYFSQLQSPMDFRFHAHGITMTLWCAMLIIQPLLIRLKYQKVHRVIGYFSYLLLPLVFYAIMDLFIFRMQGIPVLYNFHLHLVALVFNSAVAFLLLYALAIYFRKKPVWHAKFMVATVFPLFTPVTDRLTFQFARPLIQYVPTIDGSPIVPVVGFVIVDVLLIILILWEWMSGKKPIVFGIVLGMMVLLQYTILNFHQFEFWRSFSEWMLG